MRAYLMAALVALFALLTACGGGAGSESGAGTDDGGSKTSNREWQAYEREAEYPNTASRSAQVITMDDGVRLSAAVMLPADEAGNEVSGSFPTIVTITGYNSGAGAIGGLNAHFVQRGYVHVSVDVRGTGGSEGTWMAFDEREKADYPLILDWVAEQDFCNGCDIGTWGPSFMGITQMFLGAQQHPNHKAMFPIVPMGDAYRDIVFAGGSVNTAFIPLWMGIVTGLGLPQTGAFDNPEMSLSAFLSTLLGVTQFQLPVILDAVIGAEDVAYDGDFWRTRSTIYTADQIRIPVFVVGGLQDIFQRGEPLLYEVLKQNTEAKLLIGPWAHIGGSTGAGLPADGVPSLNNIALQWFDQHLKGMDSGASAQPDVTQYVYGLERYKTEADWPNPDAAAERWYLRGNGELTEASPESGEASQPPYIQQPVNGVCSGSTSQWLLGVLEGTPCQTDNRLTEITEITYTSAPFAEDYYINGPIQADIWLTTPQQDANVVVRVTSVSPDGASFELTDGIMAARHRAVDESRSRYLDGQMIQPYHPFTKEAEQLLSPLAMEPTEVAVEIFPTSAVIPAGHSLRISVGPSDFPHAAVPVNQQLEQLLAPVTILSSAEYPSSVVVPVVPLSE
jgi:putative CocE/NonD family hydrolase